MSTPSSSPPTGLALGAGELNSPTTLIVGRYGRLASAFGAALDKAKVLGRADMDITVRDEVNSCIADARPRIIINCAAETDMKVCEENPDLAWRLNVLAVRNLARAATANGAKLVHFSSDYALTPINEYGWTKRASEPLADLTLRVKVYDASHWAWKRLREGQCIEMSVAEFSNPITTTGLVNITSDLIRLGATGLFPVGTAERLNFYQIGLVWAEALGADPQLVTPIAKVQSTLPRLEEMFLSPHALMDLGFRPPSLLEDAKGHISAFPYSKGVA